MRPKKTSLIYRILRSLIDFFFPRMQVFGMENLPEEPCILVGNHSQMNGPLASELRLDIPHETWCAGEMMKRNEVADYAFTDFWSFKPRWTHPFFRLLSHLITPLAVCLLANSHTIPVYHDVRLRDTFRRSVDAMADGESLMIFPEKNEKGNHILYAFQDKFVDTARFYYKKTGRCASFVPVYICPRLKRITIGRPTVYRPEEAMPDERARVCAYLRDEITAMAEALPEHTVVPYRNIPKRDYPTNRPGSRKTGAGRRPYVDYRGLRLNRLNEPRFSHLKWILGWVFYFSMYFITENLIPAERCRPIHCALDDLIPFCEAFAVIYVLWYLYVFGALLYYLLHDGDCFRGLSKFILATQVIAMFCYVVWPSRQDLRPAVFERDNILTQLMAFIYRFDTSTGVCPSLHVAYSLGVVSTAWKDRLLPKGWRWALTVFALLVCAAVCFVKQHSALDVLAAVPVCLAAELFAYGKSWWLPRLRR